MKNLSKIVLLAWLGLTVFGGTCLGKTPYEKINWGAFGLVAGAFTARVAYFIGEDHCESVDISGYGNSDNQNKIY